MSSYSTSRVTITPEGRILQQINASGCTFFDLSRPVLGSVDLAGYADALRNVETVADLEAGWARLAAMPDALNTLEQGAPIELAAFATLQSVGQDDFVRAGSLRTASSYLASAIENTVDHLRSDERELTAMALSSALVDLGYTVTPGVGEHVKTIAAYKSVHLIAAVVSDGGNAEIDTAGLSGDSCAEPLAALDAALRARGVDLHIERRVDHGESGGGTLIQRAARAKRSDLAAGLVAVAEGTAGAGSKRRVARSRTQRVGGVA